MPKYTPEQRMSAFLEKVDKSSSEHGCWLWTGNIAGDGYGKISIDGRMYPVHRYAYETFVNAIPSGLYVCHTCDVRSCVNPKHLFLGSLGDNNRDRAAKGRSAKGEQHGSHTHPEHVARGDNHYARQRPELIARGDDHAYRKHPELHARGERINTAKLSEDKVRDIRRRFEAGGVTQPELAAEYGVHKSLISLIVRRKVWKHIV